MVTIGEMLAATYHHWLKMVQRQKPHWYVFFQKCFVTEGERDKEEGKEWRKKERDNREKDGDSSYTGYIVKF